MLLPAVLHPDVVDFLRTEFDSNLKTRVWECIEKLRQQQFDGGLRVKKLKGIAKRVWEARITQASRLIFTYNKSRQPDTGEPQTYIAVQDICLDHDDVSRRAKARNQTSDVQWLDAEVVEAIGNILDERPVLTPAEQSALDAAQIEELQLVTSFTDELLGNIQWRIVDSELEWQRAIIQQDADLPLKLTPEEYELVKLYGNLLLSGSAGTGKTTVGLYRLLKSLEALPDGKRLYVAYNPILLKEAQKQFKQLISGSDADIDSIFYFKTIRDLCLDILSITGQNYFPEDEVTYQIFEQLYRRQSYQPYSPALVWDEIRSIIKGAHLEISSYQLSQKQYEQLGKKRSSVIPQKDRYKAYKVAEWYQGLLKKEGRFDEIDLAREVLKAIRQGKGEGYQLIVCDEVQDFTELQLELLVRLVAPGGHLFFAGDLHQMISPSGFRWEDLKTKFFKGQRQAIQKTLNFNFRSVGSLVNLANQILKLRYRLLRERIGDIGQPTSSYGECARLIAAPLETLQPSLGQLNPDDAILVRTEADKQRLSEEFQSSFVFTIEEAKGLEFDTVFLVEFFKPRQSLWNRVLGSKRSLNETEEPELRLELNLLYVAVTRARRILNIWETQLSAVWSQEELVSFLQPLNSESVRENRVEPTEEMWRDRGCYYLECGFYRQAIECFEKSGDIELQRQSTAKLLLQERKYSESAQILVELQDWQQVAQLFEKIYRWQEAANCWEKAGNSERQKLCEAKVLEAGELWEDAAQLWEDIRRFEDAKRCWLKSGNEQKKAEIRAVEFEQKKQWLQAAEQYELVGMPEKAEEYRQRKAESLLYEAVKLYTRGVSKSEKGNYQGAITDYTEALRINPNLDDAYYNRGVLRGAHLKDHQGAIFDFNEALRINPNSFDAYVSRGFARSELGDNQGAIADFNQALRLNPNILPAYINRGFIRSKLGDYQGAIADFNQALRLNPNNAEAYIGLGSVRSNQGDDKGAIADFNQALRLNPNNLEAYYNRGVIRSKLGDDKGAIADFNQALRLNPNNAEAYIHRGFVCSEQGDHQGAIADFNQALRVNPNNAEAYIHRGLVRKNLGDYSRAIADFNETLRLNPNHAEAYINRGFVRAHCLGDYQGAIADFNETLRINPNHGLAYSYLGLAHFELGDYKRAIAGFNEALELSPNEANSYYIRGLAHSKNRDFEAANKDLQKAANLFRQQGKINAYQKALKAIDELKF